MPDYNKPLPVIEKWNEPYWQAAKRHEFLAQHCTACGYIHLPPGPACTNCLSPDQDWVQLSGKGTIYSYGGKGSIYRSRMAFTKSAMAPRLCRCHPLQRRAYAE